MRTVLVVTAVLVGLAAVAALAGASSLVSPLGPLAVAAACVLAGIVWSRPVVGSVAVAAIAPALAGLGRGVGIPGLKLSELLVLVCTLVLVFRRPVRWRSPVGSDAALAVFAVSAALLSAYHVSRRDVPLDTTLLVSLQPAFLLLTWWAASRGVEQWRDAVVVLRWVLLASTVPAGLAVLQYFDVPGVRQALISLTLKGGLVPLPGERDVRVTGPFPIWHSLGGYLLLPTVLVLVLLLRGDRRLLPRPLLIVILVLDAGAVVLSVTVTLVIWLPVAVLIAAVLAKRTPQALAALAVLVLAAFLAFPTAIQDRIQQQSSQTSATAAISLPHTSTSGLLPQTLDYRILVWQRDYLPVVSRAASFGLGTDTPEGVLFGATENQALTFVLRGGTGLLLAACAAVGAVGVRSLRHARARGNPLRSAALACFGVTAFLPVAAMVWPYLSNAGLSYALFGVAGAALAVEPTQEPEPSPWTDERGVRHPARARPDLVASR